MLKSKESSRFIKMLNLLQHLRATRFPSLARRYLVLNAFDGIMASLGFVAGYFAGGGVNTQGAFKGVLAAGFAMALSGLVSALLTEAAEQRRELEELERALMRKLDDTLLEKSRLLSVVLSALINATAPLAGVLVVAAPLWDPLATVLGGASAWVSLALALASLFSLGLVLGGLNRLSLGYGAAFLAAGLIVTLVAGV
jgi:predicted membrane protein (TIGR00267 family)